MRSVDFDGTPDGSALRWGLVCNEAAVSGDQVVGGKQLDVALWESPAALSDRAEVVGYTTVAVLPFDHERRMVSVLADAPGGERILITQGAPEAVLDHCAGVPERARTALAAEFAAGNRVVAIATRPAPGQAGLTAADERDLHLAGLLVFLDAPKASAGPALRRLAGLGVTVKIVTGDNAAVAAKVCSDLGLPVGATLTGADVDKLDDAGLQAAIGTATVFARVSPGSGTCAGGPTGSARR